MNFMKKNSTVVYNYPLKVDYDHQSSKEFDLVYLGDITKDRGALNMIRILSILKKEIQTQDLIFFLSNHLPFLKN